MTELMHRETGEWGQGRVVDLGDINRRWGLEAYLLLWMREMGAPGTPTSTSR